MALDPSIIAIFGEVPAGVDLGEHKVIGYNASVCVVLGLAAISVALRFYVRSIKGAKIWHDDYVILISVIVFAEPFIYAAAVTSTKISTALSCSPVSYFWNRYLGARGSCINGGLFFFTSGIVNMLDDIVILLVPVPRIWELQMNKRTKFSIFGIMLLGGL
ncbi:hypothetical protein C8035_v010761 [Colletotrichum spinosum]|uniref:Rhodopsin domain-containing protein n=1 Tax=Colletotrichum spinosum TaxID=1347390 RepID=A0A4R8QJM9_9PEZI|nr:hypothetical protein C8035_v010761 [Colletotrichum spinosum]